MKSLFILIVNYVVFCTLLINGQDKLVPNNTEYTPIIDGILESEVWEKSIAVKGFKTYVPDFGKNAAQETVAYITYDSKNLYFAFKCFDDSPEKIKSTLTTRDNISQDDWVCVNLDTYNDKQSLYAFYVNPFGIQMDSRVAGTVETDDISYDLVWQSAGKITNEGYIVEICIPLKSIRYSEESPTVMGLYLERRIARFSEHSSFPEFDPAKGYAVYSQLKQIVFHNLETPVIIEILPAVTYSNKSEILNGKLSEKENKGEFSLTGKYGLTSNLTIEGTYNPDFSQIESDAGQVDVNLRYDLFYSEKRPFFLEGSEIFKLAATSTTEVDPIKALVHTRTIVNPIIGIKLSGKITDDITLASIYSMDDLSDRGVQYDDRYASFGIFRIKKSFSDDSFLGTLFTGREQTDKYNRVIGFDGRIRLSESGVFEFNNLFSFSKYEDGFKTNGEYTIGLNYTNQTRDFDYQLSIRDISKNFYTETGYITRTGITAYSLYTKPKYYPPSEIFRRLDIELFSAQINDKFSRLWETNNYTAVTFILPGDLYMKVKYSYSNEIFLDQKFKTGGFHIAGGGWFTNQLYFGFLYRKINAIYYSSTPFEGNSNKLSINAGFLPFENLEIGFGFAYIDFYKDSDNTKVFEYPLFRTVLTYQYNKYLVFREIIEYNRYRRYLLNDFLASFTYIPGTVFHIGYGSFFEKIKWQDNEYADNNRFLETQRGFFIKMSYLWRS